MKKKLIILIALAFATIGLRVNAATVEDRVTKLEKQVNQIIDGEKERTEALNKLADAVMRLEQKLSPELEEEDVEYEGELEYE